MSKNHQERSMPLSISQNFLTSRRTIIRIINLAKLNTHDHVIEIGPGKGHITRELVRRCGTLTAIELDASLYSKLCDAYTDCRNIKLIHRDFLHHNLPVEHDYKIFANIPFSSTTGIVKKLTGARNPPVDSWLVMEKGAAKRFMGKPCENALSLSLKPFFECRIVYYFTRNDFHPAPAVDTVLLNIRRKQSPDITHAQRGAFDYFIHACLSHPDGWRRLLSAKQASYALRLAGLPPIETRGEILYIQWLCLFRCMNTLRGKQ